MYVINSSTKSVHTSSLRIINFN